MGEVTLAPVDAESWRAVEAVDTGAPWMATTAHYLLLCHYGGVWKPLAIHRGGEVVGFVMWGFDPDDGHHWIGGFSVDQRFQGNGDRPCGDAPADRPAEGRGSHRHRLELRAGEHRRGSPLRLARLRGGRRGRRRDRREARPVRLELQIALSLLHKGHRSSFGADPSQVGDLSLPRGAGPHPVAVLLHGGYWQTTYGKLVMGRWPATWSAAAGRPGTWSTAGSARAAAEAAAGR
jgi:hypothetical protein